MTVTPIEINFTSPLIIITTTPEMAPAPKTVPFPVCFAVLYPKQ
jgi:hypothetical protein